MTKLRRTNSWFEHDRIGKRQLKRESTKELFERILLPEFLDEPTTVLEIGLNEGASTLWLLQHLFPAEWCGIDPWRPGRKHHVEMFATYERNFWYNLRVSGATHSVDEAALAGSVQLFEFPLAGAGPSTRCRVVKDSSHRYLMSPVDKDYPDEYFDLFIVDGDHSAIGCLTDLVLGWRKLKVGGLIVLDDYDRRWHQARPNVHEAVNAWWNCYEHFSEKVVETRKHVVFRKTHNR